MEKARRRYVFKDFWIGQWQRVWAIVIYLNSQRRLNVVVSHMFSKELTHWRSSTLEYRREYAACRCPGKT